MGEAVKCYRAHQPIPVDSHRYPAESPAVAPRGEESSPSTSGTVRAWLGVPWRRRRNGSTKSMNCRKLDTGLPERPKQTRSPRAEEDRLSRLDCHAVKMDLESMVAQNIGHEIVVAHGDSARAQHHIVVGEGARPGIPGVASSSRAIPCLL